MAGPVAPVVELAPAKINLCLHVTGRRADGYHELDSLVAFADLGDTVALEFAESAVRLLVFDDSASASAGSETSVVPSGTGNLAWRALALGARSAGGLADGLTLVLRKRLPAGAGLGGGSSDAAAVLRALARLTAGGSVPAGGGAVGLGADVPMCLEPRPWRARGIGDRLDPISLGRDLPAILVWPGRATATPAVFAARRGGFGAPVPTETLARLADDPVTALAGLRNDLTDAACRLEPAVAEALAAVGRLPGCRLARMSGSGSAVFGLFDRGTEAATAAEVLRRARPAWWIHPTVLRCGLVETRLGAGTGVALP